MKELVSKEVVNMRTFNRYTIPEYAYNKGLKDAWEVVRKLFQIDGDTLEELFGDSLVYNILQKYCIFDVTQIFNEYEEKQKQDIIQVGDDVGNDSR